MSAELTSTIALQEQPAVDAATSAEHAARLGLPRITAENAAQHPPPSLNTFRTAAARAPANSVPALWYWQMTGDEWSRDGHSFDIEKKRHRRMVWRGGSKPRAARTPAVTNAPVCTRSSTTIRRRSACGRASATEAHHASVRRMMARRRRNARGRSAMSWPRIRPLRPWLRPTRHAALRAVQNEDCRGCCALLCHGVTDGILRGCPSFVGAAESWWAPS